ncbi:MAG: ATP phosphoribosyltransferase regulatory subunit, partial [bacterium]
MSMLQEREITMLPPGVRVYLPRESLRKRRLVNDLFSKAEMRDFGELDLPTLDYYESITRGVSQDLARRTYQLVDDEGELLALRPDATAQVAKILSGRLSTDELPGRYCYSCRNFRAFELRRGELREFQQFGAEILGKNRFQSDLDLMIFALEIIEDLELEDAVMDLGHVGLYKGIVNGTGLSDQSRRELWSKIHRKNTRELGELLKDLALDDDCKDLLQQLPTMYGEEE